MFWVGAHSSTAAMVVLRAFLLQFWFNWTASTHRQYNGVNLNSTNQATKSNWSEVTSFLNLLIHLREYKKTIHYLLRAEHIWVGSSASCEA